MNEEKAEEAKEEEKKEIEKAIEKIEQKIEEIKEEKEAKKEKFCPKCNSKNIRTDFGPQVSGGLLGKFSAIGAPYDYICNDCGFRGKIFPEIEVKEEKEQEKESEEEKKKEEKKKD